MSPSQAHYDAALRKMLSDETLRIFLWRLIVEDCRVFQEDFTLNASAYCLLAKQEIGKRLLEDAKLRDPEAVFKAEREYRAMMEQSQTVGSGGKEDFIELQGD